MYGSSFALKKSLLLSLSSFIPFPVSTLAASILISKIPVDGSVDVKVSVASHFLKFPLIGTDALTPKSIVLCNSVILNTGTSAGACARVTDGIKAQATRQKVGNRICVVRRSSISVLRNTQRPCPAENDSVSERTGRR